MGTQVKLGCNEHNSVQFNHFRKTFGVNNKNKSPNDNNVNNMMPIVVNDNMNLNSCGGGYLSESMLQNVCHDVYALDTVSNVNMNVCDVNNLLRNFHRASDINSYFAPQHVSPPGPTIAHVDSDHQPFSRNGCTQVYHGSVHKVDRFNYIFIDHFDNSDNQFVYMLY